MIRKLMLARFTVLAVIFIFNIFSISFTLADSHSDFYAWLNSYKKDAFKINLLAVLTGQMVG